MRLCTHGNDVRLLTNQLEQRSGLYKKTKNEHCNTDVRAFHLTVTLPIVVLHALAASVVLRLFSPQAIVVSHNTLLRIETSNQQSFFLPKRLSTPAPSSKSTVINCHNNPCKNNRSTSGPYLRSSRQLLVTSSPIPYANN